MTEEKEAAAAWRVVKRITKIWQLLHYSNRVGILYSR